MVAALVAALVCPDRAAGQAASTDGDDVSAVPQQTPPVADAAPPLCDAELLAQMNAAPEWFDTTEECPPLRAPPAERPDGLRVHFDAPRGSGGSWSIQLHHDDGAHLCAEGSVRPLAGVQWHEHFGGNLPFTEDVDGDGRWEFVMWDLGTGDDDEGGAYELSVIPIWPRVYRRQSGKWRLDRSLTAIKARVLAAAYRDPATSIPDASAYAGALEAYADGESCPSQ